MVGKLLRFDDDKTSAVLKLRSNGSFVLWYSTKSTSYDDESETMQEIESVKDGNWVIKEVGDTVVVKIFGREHTINTVSEMSYNPYSDSSSSDSSEKTKIFSDNLSISEEGSGILITSSLLDGVFEIQ